MAEFAFHFGWPPEIIENMPLPDFTMYKEALSVVRAREGLRLLDIANYPTLTPPDRKKVFSKFKKEARIESHKASKKWQSAEAVAKMLRNKGF